MSLFLTVHGIDGTGKTTIANQLPKALGRILGDVRSFYELEIPELEDDTVCLSSSEKSLQKKVAQSEIVRHALLGQISIIKDRWTIDVAASNSFQGGLHGEPLAPDILKPDVSILLTCGEAERMRRIHARANPTPEDLIPKEPGTRAMFLEEYMKANMPLYCDKVMAIDTTYGSPGVIVEQVLEEIENYVGV